MPIYEMHCPDCGRDSELLVMGAGDSPVCPHCGGSSLERLMSRTSGLTGRARQDMPGPGDTSCCGSTPGQAGCAGPGSCCGKTF